ncbi:MAG: YeeE/YedE family protein [Caldimonas sp.]
MHIDSIHFTPWSSLVGGVLIGLSASLYVVGLGRIAGIAGIVGTSLQALLGGTLRGQGARLAFLLGMIVAPAIWLVFRPLPPMTSVAGTGPLLVAGLLVGIGVRMGNGCTSGHGVCGLSRFSLRSLVNVVAFMGAGLIAVYVIRHLF